MDKQEDSLQRRECRHVDSSVLLFENRQMILVPHGDDRLVDIQRCEERDSGASDYFGEDEVRLPPKPALIGEPRCWAEKLLTGNSVDLHAIHVLMDAGGGETGAHHSNAVSRIDEGSGEDGHHLFAPAEIRVGRVSRD